MAEGNELIMSDGAQGVRAIVIGITSGIGRATPRRLSDLGLGHLGPSVRARCGRVVNVSSVGMALGQPGSLVYGRARLRSQS